MAAPQNIRAFAFGEFVAILPARPRHGASCASPASRQRRALQKISARSRSTSAPLLFRQDFKCEIGAREIRQGTRLQQQPGPTDRFRQFRQTRLREHLARRQRLALHQVQRRQPRRDGGARRSAQGGSQPGGATIPLPCRGDRVRRAGRRDGARSRHRAVRWAGIPGNRRTGPPPRPSSSPSSRPPRKISSKMRAVSSCRSRATG